MPLSEKEMLDKLKASGITSLDELVQNIAKQSAAKAEFDRARGLSAQASPDYFWTGKNYTIYHPE